MYAAQIPRLSALRELRERRTSATLSAQRLFALLLQSGESEETARQQAEKYAAKQQEIRHG